LRHNYKELPMSKQLVLACSLSLLACAAARFATADDAAAPRCQRVDAKLVEDRVTTGCNPGEAACFLGQLTNHWLHASTHFVGDSSAPPAATAAPGWRTYSGLFDYITADGTIHTRETGVTHPAAGHPESGAVTAHQQILGGTGAYEGVTGHFFVSGFNVNGHVTTDVIGEVCRP
jgi:hypothetical protein